MGRAQICGVGTTFEAKRWLSLDPCGFFGISLSWSVHLYALGTIFALLLSNSTPSLLIFTFVYFPCSVLAMTSLYMASTTNPGAVPMGARPLVTVRPSAANNSSEASRTSQRPIRRCHKCNDNFKPTRAHHDSVTGRCIVKFDHFCPWVNNSIGALNHKFFCLFLMYTAVCCLVSLILLVIRVIQCGQVKHTAESPGGTETTTQAERVGPERFLSTTPSYVYSECNHFYDNQWIWGLAVSSVVFLLFTSVMSCEQLDAIETGKSKIARMKMGVGQGGTEFSSVTEEFNEMFGGSSPKATWHWYLPIPVVFPRGMKKVVLGYDWDETFDALPYNDVEESETSTNHEDDTGEEHGLQMTVPLSVPPRKGMGSREVSAGSIHSVSSDGLNRRRNDSAEIV